MHSPSLALIALHLTSTVALMVYAPCAMGQDGSGVAKANERGVAADTAARIELETLAGATRMRDAALGDLTSLAREGAAFARYPRRTAAASTSDGAARPFVPGGGAEVDGGAAAPAEAALVALVSLVGGDRLRGRVRGGEGDALWVDLGGVELALSIDTIQSVLFEARIPRQSTQAPAPLAGTDVLYISAGTSAERTQGLDRAEGLVEAFTADGVDFEDSRVGRRTYPWSRVAALFIAAVDGEAARPAPTSEGAEALEPVLVGLAQGGRLSGRLRRMDATQVELVRPSGAVLVLPAALVTEVVLADGSFEFLSELEVSDAGPVSLFGDDLGFTWPHRIDRAVDGGPLSVMGQIESRGIGVHAPSRLTWRLTGPYARLRLAAAVDDSGLGTDRGGSVVFRVLGDGRELWKSGLVRANQAPTLAPTIDLRGISELTLEVDPSGDFVLDRANWLRPLLVRG
ncbi:MAG: NPCBM/NEW2 domain-containing protein [Planctomycetota bacterium]